MVKRAVFAGKPNEIPIGEMVRHLGTLAAQEILEDIQIATTVPTELRKPLYLTFTKDEIIEAMLEEMKLPQDSLVIRVTVLNEERLKERAPGFCREYALNYCVYEDWLAPQPTNA